MISLTSSRRREAILYVHARSALLGQRNHRSDLVLIIRFAVPLRLLAERQRSLKALVEFEGWCQFPRTALSESMCDLSNIFFGLSQVRKSKLRFRYSVGPKEQRFFGASALEAGASPHPRTLLASSRLLDTLKRRGKKGCAVARRAFCRTDPCELERRRGPELCSLGVERAAVALHRPHVQLPRASAPAKGPILGSRSIISCQMWHNVSKYFDFFLNLNAEFLKNRLKVFTEFIDRHPATIWNIVRLYSL